MKIVERFNPSFQWAKPLQGSELDVNRIGADLQVTGFVPTYKNKEPPCDLIHEYKKFPKQLATGQRTGTQSPEMCFANANTDEKLIAFVRRFGPVVAKCVEDTRMVPDKELGEPRFPSRLIAQQDMQELRNEHAVYRAGLELVLQLSAPDYDYVSAQQLIQAIASGIKKWPQQWKREKSERRVEPRWNLSTRALERIEQLSSVPPDPVLADELTNKLDGRIVICELVNSFPSIAFPNPMEMHSSIKFGVRPLLYAILRRQFLYPRGFLICSNSECRNFFNIERAGQQFCSPKCSLHHRQRIYWQEYGKKLRKKRTAQLKKAGK
jgi:hypothetical protein